MYFFHILCFVFHISLLKCCKFFIDLIAVCIKYHFILHILLTPVPMCFLVILMLGLYLTTDQCHGFAEEGLRELCRELPNTEPNKNCNCPAKNGPSMGPSEPTTFSCSNCSPGTMYDPYVCKYCYKTEENEAFLCKRCKFGSKSKPVICDECSTNPDHDSQKYAEGLDTNSYLLLSAL